MGRLADSRGGRLLVRTVRRNPLTLACIVAGMVGVGVWLFFLEQQVGHVENHQTTIDHFIQRSSACTEHPHSEECLEGITNAAERCLENIQCADLLASAGKVSGELHQRAREHLQEGASHQQTGAKQGRGPPVAASPSPAAEAKTPGTGHHHSHPAPAGGGGQPSHHHPGGGGHHGGSGQHPAPTVPEPTTPAPSPASPPESTPGNSPEKPPPSGQSGVNVCVENPLLPACVHVNLGVGQSE